MYGPTGIGALFGKRHLLAHLPPVFGGGGMVDVVNDAYSTFANPPHKFEPGTPPLAEAVGFAAACDYLGSIGWDQIQVSSLLKILFLGFV